MQYNDKHVGLINEKIQNVMKFSIYLKGIFVILKTSFGLKEA